MPTHVIQLPYNTNGRDLDDMPVVTAVEDFYYTLRAKAAPSAPCFRCGSRGPCRHR